MSKAMDIANGELLLRQLGNKVRELRRSRGFTVREAAERSGLSLRFYHHLEAGTSNISITKLADVAGGLGVSVQDLFRRELRLPVALIGLRGAGKSTIGPRLAKILGCTFIELDDHIEKASGLSLNGIFSMHGEEYYRKLESQCLNRILPKKQPCVIELPGGIVKDEGVFDMVRTLCTTVWIKADPKDHMERVYRQGDTRPMANRKNAMEELKSILAERESLYSLADITVNTSENSVKDTLIAIKQRLTEMGWNTRAIKS